MGRTDRGANASLVFSGKRDWKELGCLKIMFRNKLFVPLCLKGKSYCDAHFSFHRVLILLLALYT
jgi:hypothetical protein